MWTRLLVAASLLEDADRTVAVVAQKTGFTSEVLFRRALRRYLDLRPAELRDLGGLEIAMAHFELGLTFSRRTTFPRRDRSISRHSRAVSMAALSESVQR
jgi:AraC-like DNA-binding protein